MLLIALPVNRTLRRIQKLCAEGRFQEAFDESHRTKQHFQGALLQVKHERSHYAMELLKKSGDPRVLARGAKAMLDRKLPDAAAELFEALGTHFEGSGNVSRALENYFEAGKAALQYGRPDWAVEMFDKAGEHEEGARMLSFKGNKAWGAMLLRQGGEKFETKAKRMEDKAAKRDIKSRDSWLAKEYAEAARQSTWKKKITPFRKHSFATMFFARGGNIEKSVGAAINAGRSDWLIPIAEMLEPPKTQIAKWAGRTAKQGHHAVAAELYEMAGEHVKGAEAAGRAGMHLWAARLYAKAGLNRAALEARLKAGRA